MAEVPPPQGYASYPRAQNMYGTYEKLKALGEGYFGLNLMLLVNLLLLLGVRLIQISQGVEAAGVALIALIVIMGVLNYRYNALIGEGLGWSKSTVILTSVLMGLNSWICCGAIGFAIVQQIASGELKKYGVSSGAFGIRKKEWQAVLDEKRMASYPPSAPPPQVS